MSLTPFRHPFFTADGFDDLFDPRPYSFDDLMPVLTNRDRSDDMILTRSSPGFEIHEDDHKYSIAIDVPGVKVDDMEIKLEDNGRVLHLSGGRKVKKGDQVSETKFVKRFTIGENVDTEKLTANLANGVLEVTAPKKVPTKKEAQVIKITQGPTAAAAAATKSTKLGSFFRRK